MSKSSIKTDRHHHNENKNSLKALWLSFWLPPQVNCPKCGSEMTEYYDPFFFAPIRTVKGKRRIRCRACRFVWRQSRERRSFLDFFNPF